MKERRTSPRVVERIEFNPAGRPSKCGHDFVKAVGGAMGNGDPESDAGAHGFLACLSEARMLSRSSGLFAQTNQEIDQSTMAGQRSVASSRDDLLGRK